MKVRVLGCGTSSGVPRIGGDWDACNPAEPKNRRLRAAVLVETPSVRVLVDTGPDLREQLLGAQVGDVDAVIWTHDHADHCHGIDDLRQLFHARGGPVRGFARPETLAALSEKFRYAFDGRDGYPAIATVEPLPDRLTLGDITIGATDQPHGTIRSAGLRFEQDGRAFGYATDFNVMTDDMRTLYQSLDLWIVDALRRRPHPSHPTLDEALHWIAELAPKRALLTHMDQSMDYAALAATLPPGVAPAYDGQEIVL